MVKNTEKKHFLLKVLLVFLAAEIAAAAFVFLNKPFLKTGGDIAEIPDLIPFCWNGKRFLQIFPGSRGILMLWWNMAENYG